ncbi:MAG: hypothetical protein ACODAU_06955 [Myxococcota bacterium]
MPYELKLPKKLKDQKWRAKTRDRERVEPPHVTILHKTRAWRIGLRDGAFLDKKPPPGDVPDELVSFVLESRAELVAAWDEIYPENPVESE